jgi:hypothetical protein
MNHDSNISSARHADVDSTELISIANDVVPAMIETSGEAARFAWDEWTSPGMVGAPRRV